MLIGEVVAQSGVSRDTIRHYEAQGLIATPGRRDNRYKEYPSSTVKRIQFVKTMQGVGFTLKRTRTFLALYDEDAATCANTGAEIQAHISELDEKIAELTTMRDQLGRTFACCDGTSLETPCTPIVNALTPE